MMNGSKLQQETMKTMDNLELNLRDAIEFGDCGAIASTIKQMFSSASSAEGFGVWNSAEANQCIGKHISKAFGL
jgi:hypothetical protein